jgi:hypothetical protein
LLQNWTRKLLCSCAFCLLSPLRVKIAGSEEYRWAEET